MIENTKILVHLYQDACMGIKVLTFAIIFCEATSSIVLLPLSANVPAMQCS